MGPNLAAGLAALLDADWIAQRVERTGGRPTIPYSPNPKAGRAEMPICRGELTKGTRRLTLSSFLSMPHSSPFQNDEVEK